MEQMKPPETKAVRSVAVVRDDWYVLARSEEVKDKPLARTLMGTPLVLFRGTDGKVGALLDRCPHRNVPLSLGRVRGRHLECGYHGWQFDHGGRCQAIPGLCGGEVDKAARAAPAFEVREQQGVVWVYGTPDQVPVRDPFSFPLVDDARYSTVRHVIDLKGSIHAAAENALDVPHTAFLHRGLFRTESSRNRIDVVVRRFADRVEAEYIGEPRPEGVIGRVLAPGGGTVQHFDRFLLPCIAQVEYRIGEVDAERGSHVMATTALTPIGDYETRMFAAVSFRLPFLPSAKVGEVAGALLKPLALRILAQDVEILAAQTETIAHFGGEQYASTPLDVLGPHILRLLRQAERGMRGEAPKGSASGMQAGDVLHESTLQMEV